MFLCVCCSVNHKYSNTKNSVRIYNASADLCFALSLYQLNGLANKQELINGSTELKCKTQGRVANQIFIKRP